MLRRIFQKLMHSMGYGKSGRYNRYSSSNHHRPRGKHSSGSHYGNGQHHGNYGQKYYKNKYRSHSS